MMAIARTDLRRCGLALLSLVIMLFQTLPFGLADEKAPTTGESPLGRYLLVASEGLYVVEPDGSCSWFYHTEPYKGQGWGDWHYLEKNQNRVQAFVIDADRNITWTMPATAFGAWKKSETEPHTGFVEHRVCLIQPLSK